MSESVLSSRCSYSLAVPVVPLYQRNCCTSVPAYQCMLRAGPGAGVLLETVFGTVGKALYAVAFLVVRIVEILSRDHRKRLGILFHGPQRRCVLFGGLGGALRQE